MAQRGEAALEDSTVSGDLQFAFFSAARTLSLSFSPCFASSPSFPSSGSQQSHSSRFTLLLVCVCICINTFCRFGSHILTDGLSTLTNHKVRCDWCPNNFVTVKSVAVLLVIYICFFFIDRTIFFHRSTCNYFNYPILPFHSNLFYFSTTR